MSDYPIERDIPLPPSSKRHYALPLLDEMGVEQSRFFPNESSASLNKVVHYVARKQARRFTMRAEERDGVSGVRVWRIE